MESGTSPPRKRPHVSAVPQARPSTQGWSRAVMKYVRTAAEGVMDRVKLEDDVRLFPPPCLGLEWTWVSENSTAD